MQFRPPHEGPVRDVHRGGRCRQRRDCPIAPLRFTPLALRDGERDRRLVARGGIFEAMLPSHERERVLAQLCTKSCLVVQPSQRRSQIVHFMLGRTRPQRDVQRRFGESRGIGHDAGATAGEGPQQRR